MRSSFPVDASYDVSISSSYIVRITREGITVTTTEANPARTEANKQTVRSLLQAMNEHQVAALHDYIAADVTDHNKIIHGEADEPGAAFDGFAQQLAAFPDIAVAPEDLIAEGARVVVRVVAGGTTTGV